MSQPTQPSQLMLDENHGRFQIRAFQPGQIKINENIFTKSLIITNEELIEDWPPQQFSELTREHFDIIRTLRPTIFLLGAGEKLQFPAIELYGDLLNLRIGVEIMDTRAACRTYNALTAEGRNVVAGLLVR